MRVLILLSFLLLNVQGQQILNADTSEYITLKNGNKLIGKTEIKYSSSKPCIQFKDSIIYNINEINLFKTKNSEYAIVKEDGFFSIERIAKKILEGEIDLYWVYNPWDLSKYSEDILKYQSDNFFSADSNTYYQVNYKNLNTFFKSKSKTLDDLAVYKRNEIISKSLFYAGFLTLGYGIKQFFDTKEGFTLYISLPISFYLYKLSEGYAEKNVIKTVDAIYEYNSNSAIK
jgi:hypothetical protein